MSLASKEIQPGLLLTYGHALDAKQSTAYRSTDDKLRKLVDKQEGHARRIKSLHVDGYQVFAALNLKIDNAIEQQEAILRSVNQLRADVISNTNAIDRIYNGMREGGGGG